MSQPNHEPTPEEIDRMTAEIRRDWTEAEHYERAGLRRQQPVFVKTCSRFSDDVAEPAE